MLMSDVATRSAKRVQKSESAPPCAPPLSIVTSNSHKVGGKFKRGLVLFRSTDGTACCIFEAKRETVDEVPLHIVVRVKSSSCRTLLPSKRHQPMRSRVVKPMRTLFEHAACVYYQARETSCSPPITVDTAFDFCSRLPRFARMRFACAATLNSQGVPVADIKDATVSGDFDHIIGTDARCVAESARYARKHKAALLFFGVQETDSFEAFTTDPEFLLRWRDKDSAPRGDTRFYYFGKVTSSEVAHAIVNLLHTDLDRAYLEKHDVGTIFQAAMAFGEADLGAAKTICQVCAQMIMLEKSFTPNLEPKEALDDAECRLIDTLCKRREKSIVQLKQHAQRRVLQSIEATNHDHLTDSIITLRDMLVKHASDITVHRLIAPRTANELRENFRYASSAMTRIAKMQMHACALVKVNQAIIASIEK